MQQFFTTDSLIQWRDKSYTISAALKQMLLLALILTIAWWIIGYLYYTSDIKWADQQLQYLTGVQGLLHPYQAQGFFNPPWALLFSFPFNFMPFELAIILQGIVYHFALTLIVFKFSPAKMDDRSKKIAACAILLSPFIADLAVEINNDWIPAIGLLVPPAWSAPFILAKPQNAIGYYASFDWKTLMRAILIGAALTCLSFVLWGVDWPLRAYNSIQRDSLGTAFNGAPIEIFGLLPALSLGGLLMAYVLYRVHIAPARYADTERQQRDLALFAVIGGLFFVPYIAGYSLALVYALLCARVPRIMMACTVLMWLVLVPTLAAYFI